MSRISLLIFALVLAGCSAQIDTRITSAVVANKQATSAASWEESSDHPDKVVATLNEQINSTTSESDREAIRSRVCSDLKSLSDEELTLFEGAILDYNNDAIFSECKTETIERIDQYFSQQKSEMLSVKDPGSFWSGAVNFRFATNIQTRDVSQGYKTRTADVGTKEVVLTFDDGPSPTHTRTILRALRQVNAKAVFFSLGKTAKAYPTILKEVLADGHSIGSHSMTHACLSPSPLCVKINGRALSTKEAIDEIILGHRTLTSLVNPVQPFFRFPNGETTPELSSELARLKMAEFAWNIDTEDWKVQSPAQLVASTIQKIEAKQRGIVLFHDIQRRTAEALPEILKELYIRGYKIVLIKAHVNK